MTLKTPALILLSLLSLIYISGCEETPLNPETSPNPANASTRSQASAAPTHVLPSLAPGIQDVSGCWRPVGADGVIASGASFELERVDADAWVFGNQPRRTKLRFDSEGRYNEINFDEAKPFFPAGYIHSRGLLSPDGNSLSRQLEGTDQTQSFKRCNLVQERPPAVLPSDHPEPAASASASADPFADDPEQG
jgi:hypothetical protein